MKVLISVMAFVLTLTIAHIALAEENLQEEMRKLFPPKTPAKNMAIEPAATTLEAPAYFAKISAAEVTLKWTAVAGADQYHLQVATDPNFKWLVKNEFEVKETSYKLNGLEGGQHYFWRVLSVTQNNEPTHRKSAFVTSMFETTAK